MTYKDLSPALRKAYADLDRESKKYPLEMVDGVLRFKRNKCVDFYTDPSNTGMLLNKMWVEAQRNNWPVEDIRTFYRMMGYSLSGFLEVFDGMSGPQRTRK